jgi:hypothetical protein
VNGPEPETEKPNSRAFKEALHRISEESVDVLCRMSRVCKGNINKGLDV